MFSGDGLATVPRVPYHHSMLSHLLDELLSKSIKVELGSCQCSRTAISHQMENVVEVRMRYVSVTNDDYHDATRRSLAD